MVITITPHTPANAIGGWDNHANIIACGGDGKPATFLAVYQSFSLTERTDGRTSWSLTVSRNSPHVEYLVPGRFVLLPPTTPYEDIVRPLVIRQITVNDTTITATGTDYLWHMLEYRLAYPRTGQEGHDKFKGTAEEVILHYINNNLVNPENALRIDPTLIVPAAHNPPLGDEVTIDGRYQSLAKIAETCCQTGNILLRGRMVEGTGTPMGWSIAIEISVGTDRSQH